MPRNIFRIRAGSPTTTTTTTAPSALLYFQDDFTGCDVVAGALTGWSSTLTQPSIIDSYYFNNGTSDPAYAYQDIITDAGRDVLYARIITDDPSGGTSRAQMTWDLLGPIPVYHTSHRMRMHPDIANLTNYSSSIRWFTLFEMWNLRDNSQGGDPAGSSRISFSIFKDSGAGQDLFWHLAYEEMQPSENVIWQVENRVANIPFGQWFTLDIYLIHGEGTDGQIRITITPDEGSPTILFDVNDSTAYAGKPELYVNQWQIFKLYTSPAIMSYMTGAGNEMSIMYNDVKWFEE